MKTANRYSARIAIRRFAHLRRKLLGRAAWNMASVARELEVCEKTVQRDMEFMQNFLRYEFVYDPTSRSFRGTVPEPIL